MFSRHSIAAILAILPASAVWAAPATDEGAARLKGVFESYLSATDGVVTVKPAGEIYDLTIDPAPLLSKLPQDTATAKISPMSYKLTDNGDGTWGVTEDQDIAWTINVKGVQDQTISAHVRSEGVWDESLAAFRENTTEMTNMVTDSVQYDSVGAHFNEQGEYVEADPDAEPVVVSRDHQKIERVIYKGKSTAAGTGGADVTGTFEAQNVTQTSEITFPGADAPLNIGFTAPSYNGTFDIKGLQTKGLLSVGAWFVANPSEELIKAGQEDLRGKLDAALPLWSDFVVEANVADAKVTSPYGEFGAGQMALTVGLNGAVPDARLHERVTLSNVSFPQELAPAWSLPLIPEKFTLDFNVKGFDLAAPAKMAVAAFDLKADEPFGKVDSDAMVKALLPTGKVNFEISEGDLTGKDYAISYTGALEYDVASPVPTGTAKIVAKGLDKVDAALTAAPPEVAGQPLMMLRMAQGLAKPGADGEQVWEIDATSPGVVKINGMAISGQ